MLSGSRLLLSSLECLHVGTFQYSLCSRHLEWPIMVLLSKQDWAVGDVAGICGCHLYSSWLWCLSVMCVRVCGRGGGGEGAKCARGTCR